MIKLRYEHINDPRFHDAVEKIDNASNMSGKTAYDFGKFKKVWDVEREKAKTMMDAVIKKYVVFGKDGRPVVAQKERPSFIKRLVGKGKNYQAGNGMFVFKDRTGYEHEAKKVLDMEFEVPVNRFAFDELLKAGLTPKELRVIEILVEEFKDE